MRYRLCDVKRATPTTTQGKIPFGSVEMILMLAVDLMIAFLNEKVVL